MPQYVYRCQVTGCKTEILLIQSIAEGDSYLKDKLFICPQCAGTECERVLGGTSFRLEGGGWFSDGYR